METKTSVMQGFVVDDLDTKRIADAKNDFERLFVTIRGVLENNEAKCMDNEEERLQVCQVLARQIKQNDWKIFENIQKEKG
jgi:hypothetical protein